jgi:hypothetical protein
MKCSNGGVPIARITSQGLAAIALPVAVLWGCILAENSISRRAYLTRLTTFNQLRQLRQGTRRVNSPAPLWITPAGRV